MASFFEIDLPEGTLRCTRYEETAYLGDEVALRETGPPTWSLDGEVITVERAEELIVKYRTGRVRPGKERS